MDKRWAVSVTVHYARLLYISLVKYSTLMFSFVNVHLIRNQECFIYSFVPCASINFFLIITYKLGSIILAVDCSTPFRTKNNNKQNWFTNVGVTAKQTRKKKKPQTNIEPLLN